MVEHFAYVEKVRGSSPRASVSEVLGLDLKFEKLRRERDRFFLVYRLSPSIIKFS